MDSESGAAGSKLTKQEAGHHLQTSSIQVGDFKQDGNMKDRDEKEIRLEEDIHDPYLAYGGSYVGDFKDTNYFRYITWTNRPKFTEKHRSLLVKHLSEELFQKLKDVTSNKNYTFSNAIMTGIITPHLGVGVTAGDENCWEVFKDLYYPIIKDWHGYDASIQKHPMDLDPRKLLFSDKQHEKFNKYVASTRIRAARNISGFALPSGATEESRAGVEDVLKKSFTNFTGELSGNYYQLGALNSDQISLLLKQGVLFQIPSASNLLTGAGAARSWPNNRGIFLNKNQTTITWVNEEDHCRIISMQLGGDIPYVFKRFCHLSHALKASLESLNYTLMWNDTLGFLGTCPSNLGTGLRASVMIKLKSFNSLIENPPFPKANELLEDICFIYDLQLRGSTGEHSAAVNAMFDISNKQRLGYSEVELVQKLIEGVSNIIAFEEQLASGEITAKKLLEIIEEEKRKKNKK